MQVLFLSTHVPVPVTNGQAIRTMSLVRALAECGHRLTFVAFASPSRKPSTFEPLSSLCESLALVPREFMGTAAYKIYFRRLATLFHDRPYAVERFRSLDMEATIERQLRTHRFDAVVADSLYALTNLPPTQVPVVLNCHNVEWLILERYAQLESNPLKRAYAKLESSKMRATEQRLGEKSAVCMVCSEQDKAVWREMVPSNDICVVPNCVDTEAYVPRKSNSLTADDPIILFQGGMDWYPNRDAVEYFVGHIFPVIRRHLPKARFIVAGRDPSPGFVRKVAASGGVEFTGTVADLRPFLAKAALAVVPLRIGSGTRLKILEAAAAGLGIVSTSLGAEGLHFEPDREIILADEPQQFATAVLALLRDSERCHMLGQAARRRVVGQYSFANLRDLVNACLSTVENTGRVVGQRSSCGVSR